MSVTKEGRISPRVDMRYWDLERLADRECVLVRLDAEDNWDSARVRIHQLCNALGWRVATRAVRDGWKVYRLDNEAGDLRRAPEKTLKAPYDKMAALRHSNSVLIECGQDGRPPGRKGATARAYQLASSRGWRVAVRQVPRGIRVYRVDRPDDLEPPGHQIYQVDPGCLRFGETLRLVLSEPEDMEHAKQEVADWCREQGISIRFVRTGPDTVDVVPARRKAK